MVQLAMTTHTGIDFWVHCTVSELVEFATEVDAAMTAEGREGD